MKKITTRVTDLVKINPKLYLEKSDYQEEFLTDYSRIGADSTYKKSFKNDIHPKLYKDLPRRNYTSHKDLAQKL